ncbi:MAG: S8 family serine peptidase [Saprospiraceae bacterium]|nr:S8 family serine peptidase [Saprospiraceae bacterium]
MLTILFFIFGVWIICKDNKALSGKIGLLFIISLIGFVVISLLNKGLSISLFVYLVSVLLFLSVSGFVLLLISGNKMAQTGIFLLLCYVSTIILNDGKDKTTSDIQNVDPDGEFLMEINTSDLESINDVKGEFDLHITQAFTPLSTEITLLDDYVLIDIPSAHINEIKEIEAALQKTGKVKWIENNENIKFEFPVKGESTIVSSGQVTNDPSVSLQWHLIFLEMDKYYKLFSENSLKPTKKAKLFILDTGLDTRHEDLNVPGLKASIDKQGHGTHCAGVAAAITNNKIGVASMSPGIDWVEIHAIQVIGDVGFGTQKTIIEGIIQAADQGADVISMSLGGITNQDREKAYNAAVKYANDKGAIVVVAAGNANLDARRYSPANAENVIAVSSVNDQKLKSGFSNNVQNIRMALAAPGEKILSTTPTNSYQAFNGTSMATPQVAGLIAVMKSLRPNINTKQAFDIIDASGTVTADISKTGKLINPNRAITSLLGLPNL